MAPKALTLLLLLAASAEPEPKCDKYTITFCDSGMCNKCCDKWCKKECENIEEAMKGDDCSCEKPPEAFTEDAFCKDKKKKFDKKYGDEDYANKLARACNRGCKTCCRGDDSFL